MVAKCLLAWKFGSLEASGPGASVPDDSPKDVSSMDVRDLVGECFTFYFDILFRLVAKRLLAWKSGSLEVWKSGSLEVWKSGSLVEVTLIKVKCFACG